MQSLQKSWIREVEQSRIVILPNNEAFVKGADVNVWDIIHSIANGTSECQLMQMHPHLTRDDIRACSLFVYLQAIGKI